MNLTLLKLELGEVREIWFLIKRLDVFSRLDWLRWCCKRARGFVEVIDHSGTVDEVWRDVWLLVLQYDLNLGYAIEELIRRCEGASRLETQYSWSVRSSK